MYGRAIGLALLMGLLLAGGCVSDRTVISQANTFHDELKPAVMDDAQLNAYLQQVGQRIIDAARLADLENFGPESHHSQDSQWMFSQGMRFHFVNSSTLNAFTTGGNHMYIYTELFRTCRSEDELAAVMAHEFAHVYGRHVQKGMNRQYAMLGGAAGAGLIGYATGGEEKAGQYATVTAAGLQLVGMSFTRGDEAQADELGFDFYVHAGWDPARFGDFFQQMIDKGYDKGPEFLSDHPSLQSRVDEAHRRAAALPANARQWRRPPVANAAEFKSLQQRAARLGRNMPNDSQLQRTQLLLAAMNRSCLTPAIREDQKQAEIKLLGQNHPQPATRPAPRRPRDRQ